jgi:MerR family transcriptional regulator, light-induced transcriptional regulator
MRGSVQSPQTPTFQRKSQKRSGCEEGQANGKNTGASGQTNGREHDEVSTAQLGWLVGTIENDIIPRLLRTTRDPSSPQTFALAGQARKDAAARTLAQQVLQGGATARAAADYIDELRGQGLSLETIYLDVMAPAARLLGQQWEDDTLDFTEVTVGLWRLQQLMYALSPAFHDDDARGVHVHRALLVPVPGSQHTLGLLMVAEFFRRAGWDVWGDPAANADDFVAEVKTQAFDLAGFSVGSETHFDVLTHTIARVRAASANTGICVMVGGPVINAQPELVGALGADGTASDAAQAVQVAHALVQAKRQAHAS